MQISNAVLVTFAAASLVCAASAAGAADADNAAKARETQAAGLNATAPADSEDIAKARQALRQKLDETHAASGFAPITVPVQLPPTDSEEAYKLREALRQKVDTTAKAASAVPQVKQPAGLPPIERIQSPLPGDKQQKLQELLRRYQNDEMSPEQYHQERAKIVGAF